MRTFQNSKKKEEKTLLKYFSQAYPDFPKGKIYDTESPDFVISLSRKRKLGIELTRLTQPKSENQEFTTAQISNLEKNICYKAQKLFEFRNDLQLLVYLFFSNNIRVNNNDVIKIVERIVLDVQNHTADIDRKLMFQIYIENPIANDHVDLIYILYHPNVKSSCWGNAGGYFVPTLSKEYLIQKINSKEDKLSLYRKKKINNFWLILVTDSFERSTSFNINNQIEAWNIKSNFDKVFLFEVMGSNVYTIK
jgi:hypothetical protein